MLPLVDIPSPRALAMIAVGADLTGLRIVGPIKLRGLSIAALPRGVNVWGPLVIEDMAELEELAPDLVVSGSVQLLRCPKLAELPAGFSAPFGLVIKDCPLLTHLPPGLHTETLSIDDDVGLVFGQRTQVKTLTGKARLLAIGEGCVLGGVELCHLRVPWPPRLSMLRSITAPSDLAALPAELSVQGDLDLQRCNSLASIPEDLSVRGTLTLPERLRALEKRTHAGSLRVTRGSELTALEGIELAGSLTVAGLEVRSLRNLTLAGDLKVVDCPSLEEVSDVTAGGDVLIQGADALRTVRRVRAAKTLTIASCRTLQSTSELTSLGEVVMKGVPSSQERPPQVEHLTIGALAGLVLGAPDDRDGWLVLADALQEAGDPRGQLIARELSHEDFLSRLESLQRTVDPELLFGPLAPIIDVRRSRLRHGLLTHAWLSFRHEHEVDAFANHPIWTTVEAIAFGSATWRASMQLPRLERLELMFGAHDGESFEGLARSVTDKKVQPCTVVVNGDKSVFANGLGRLLGAWGRVPVLELRVSAGHSYMSDAAADALHLPMMGRADDVKLVFTHVGADSYSGRGMGIFLDAAARNPTLRRLTVVQGSVAPFSPPAGFHFTFTRSSPGGELDELTISQPAIAPESSSLAFLLERLHLGGDKRKIVLQASASFRPTEADVARIRAAAEEANPSLESFTVEDADSTQ
ncbi:MAG: hypothetical protein U0271_04060 [Polyangiaceae bacterium]